AVPASQGPLEVLLVAGPLVLTGHTNEFVARLPFALVHLGVLLGSYLLARRLFTPFFAQQQTQRPERWASAVALGAILVLALDGFLIAFARIVQYQGVVLLLTVAALWCCWRFYEGDSPRRSLLAAALFFATGVLAHYDTLFVAPALAWVVLVGGWQRGWRDWQPWMQALGGPVVLGTVLLTSFYLPFVLHERFSRTLIYLNQRIAEQDQAGPFFNNLPRYYGLATYYNTTFQMTWLPLILVCGVLVWLCHYWRPHWAGWLLALLLLAGCLVLVLAPAQLVLANGVNLTIVALGLPLVGAVLAPAMPMALRVVLCWFSPPFIAMACLIARPNTHFYTTSLPAALLIGLTLVLLAHWLVQRRQQWLLSPLLLAGSMLVLLVLPYMGIVYLRQQPEYRRTFPAARPGIYLAAYGDTLPEDGSYFGFTHRDGWKVIGELYREGVLVGDYDSNQKSLVTGWYTRGAFRCGIEPSYYVAARLEPYLFVPEDYHLFGSVTVEGKRTLDIYTRERVSEPPRTYALEDYASQFDAQPILDFPMQRSMAETLPQYPAAIDWQQGVHLRGYDLDHAVLSHGRVATLLLSWDITSKMDASGQLASYDLVVELVDAQGALIASATPLCEPEPPGAWTAAWTNQTAFSLTARPDIPPGTYVMRVGLRHHISGAWLPRRSGDPTWLVTTIRIE
ncbi:MAG: hypothetical protein HC837_15730, partial [Chloroflexaceae bacterium]|nr:hypothetical protein [Chloroflexaceae bacterium]